MVMRRKADKAPELIAQAHVYGGWESSLDHTEGDDGIPVPLAPDLGLNQGRVREVAAADCLDEDTAVPFPGRDTPGRRSVQWPEPHFKEGTFRYYYGVHCAN
ncbi:hypothetical protein B5X24_HaOG210032 [Helicoverpa armigera]|nr:hypothetical protein B5X24_HaOG210032 [Helicoverpa armigera]